MSAMGSTADPQLLLILTPALSSGGFKLMTKKAVQDHPYYYGRYVY